VKVRRGRCRNWRCNRRRRYGDGFFMGSRYVLVLEDGVVAGQWVAVVFVAGCVRAVHVSFLEYDISHLEDA
jgi:hypothetical protein